MTDLTDTHVSQDLAVFVHKQLTCIGWIGREISWPLSLTGLVGQLAYQKSSERVTLCEM